MDTSTLECSEPYVIVNVKSMGRLENPMLIPQGTGTTPEGAPTTATASSTGPTTATADDYVSPDALSVRKPYIIINVKSLNRIENSRHLHKRSKLTTHEHDVLTILRRLGLLASGSKLKVTLEVTEIDEAPQDKEKRIVMDDLVVALVPSSSRRISDPA
ncbi:hypothetical protein KCU85_g6816, partial [Aureobasidium melanogenum]